MVVQNSEQALTALERSQLEPVKLLDDAANIIGVNLSSLETAKVRDHQNKTSFQFREQWILKWLIRRLDEVSTKYLKSKSSTDLSVADKSLIGNPQTWGLFNVLARSVSSSTLVDILLERNFFKTFSNCIAIVLEEMKIGSLASHREPHAAVSQTNGTDRPRKRQRLSPSLHIEGSHTISYKQIPLQLLDVAHACSSALKQVSGKDASFKFRHSVPSWIAHPSEAAEFLGSLFELANITFPMMDRDRQKEQQDLICNTIQDWVYLWDAQASASSLSDENALHKYFNEYCLSAALRFIDTGKSNKLYSVTSVLERKVALHTILPMKAEFDRKFRTAWTRKRDTFSWAEIEPIYSFVSDFLQGLTGMRQMQMDIPHDRQSLLGTRLFLIASHLVSRSDTRRWQLEQPWLEALFVCLLYSLCESELPQLQANSEGVLAELESLARVATSDASCDPSDFLSDTLTISNIELPLPLLSYLTVALVSQRNHPISLKALSTLIRMNPAVFIPNMGNSSSQLCLESLCERISEIGPCTELENHYILSEVVLPLLQGFSKLRDLDVLIGFLTERLRNAFHARARGVMDQSVYHGELIWDNEDVLEKFKSICNIQATLTFGERLILDVAQSLEGIADVIGTTNETFAKLALAEQILEARVDELSDLPSLPNVIRHLTRGILSALSRTTDYQGQRWRLWAILRVIAKIDPTFRIEDMREYLSPSVLISSTSRVDEVLQKFRKAFLLMESLQSFALILETTEANDNLRLSLLNELEQALQVSLQSGKLSTAEGWDGRLASLQDHEQLCLGYLGELSRSPNLTTESQNLPRSLLVLLCCITLRASIPSHSSQPHPSSLPEAAEALLSTLQDSRGDLLTLYTEAVISTLEVSETSFTVPKLLQTLVRIKSARKEAAKIAESLSLRLLSHPDILNSSGGISALVLLSSIVSSHPIHVGLPENFELFTKIVSTLFLPEGARSVAVGMRCVKIIFETMFRRLLNIGNESKRFSTLRKVCEWMEKQTSSHRTIPKDTFEIAFTVDVQCALEETSGLSDVVSSKKIQQYRTSCKDHLLEYLAATASLKLTASSASKFYQAFSQLGKLDRESAKKFAASPELQRYLTERENLSPDENWEFKVVLDGIEQTLRQLQISRTYTDTETSLTSKLSAQDGVGEANWTIERLAKRAETLTKQMTLDQRRYVVHQILDHTSTPCHQDRSQGRLFEPLLVASIALNTSAEDLKTSTALSNDLSQIASLDYLMVETDLARLAAFTEVASTILETHPEIVNQSMIDTILKSITWVSSSQANVVSPTRLNSIPAASIFDRLCGLISVLMSRYRRRLTGRYHLLVPALQNLLKCLFYSPTQKFSSQNTTILKQRQMFLKSLPKWLTESSTLQEEALGPSSADIISRILQSLCNPTASSARAANKSRTASSETFNLNDETKKVKRLAAQHMQYLIMTYCQVSLDGYIAPEVKEKLMLGLYAVLSAMGPDLMRAMNAAMDTSARAIFKGLYDDWIRYGKWNQT